MEILAKNVDFNSLTFRSLHSRNSSYGERVQSSIAPSRVSRWVYLKNRGAFEYLPGCHNLSVDVFIEQILNK